MYAGVLALLCRSLRMDIRSRETHLVRVALLGGIYLALVQTQVASGFASAPGLNFFTLILWLNLFFVSLIGIGAFSNVITEEKEDDTLGLLQMAGINSLGLLLGKIGGRLLQAMTFLIVQYPFALLAITFGGVGIGQIRAAYVSLGAYLVMLAGLGVFCSTIARNSRSASRLMVVLLAIYIVAPLLAYSILQDAIRTGSTSPARSLAWLLSEMSIFSQTSEILATGFDSTLFNVQVISNTILGIVAFILSWGLFDVCTRNPTSELVTRGPLMNRARSFRLFNPGRPRLNPIAWKDFHFATGGIGGLLIRFGFYSLLFGLTWLLRSLDPGNWDMTEVCAIYLWIALYIFPIDASMLIARSLQDEIRGQTISALVMLPRSVESIVYSKLAGALIGLIPSVTCFAFAFVGAGFVQALPEFIESLANNPKEFLLIAPNVVLSYFMLPHLTLVIAMIARWGVTPISIAALIVFFFVEMMLVGMLAMVSSGGPNALDGVAIILAIVNGAVCILCHYGMIRQFAKHAEK